MAWIALARKDDDGGISRAGEGVPKARASALALAEMKGVKRRARDIPMSSAAERLMPFPPLRAFLDFS